MSRNRIVRSGYPIPERGLLALADCWHTGVPGHWEGEINKASKSLGFARPAELFTPVSFDFWKHHAALFFIWSLKLLLLSQTAKEEIL